MAENSEMVATRISPELAERLENYTNVYDTSNAEALRTIIDLGLKADEPRVLQVEVPRDLVKQVEDITDARDEEKAETLEYLLRQGVRADDHDTFLAEFPADDTSDILAFADRERLDRDAAVRDLVEKGLAVERGEYSKGSTAVGVEVPGKMVIFGLVLFVLATTPPERIPIYTQTISESLRLLSLGLVLFGIFLFMALPVMDFTERMKERVRERYESRQNGE
jgi:predicted DNA-binding protein